MSGRRRKADTRAVVARACGVCPCCGRGRADVDLDLSPQLRDIVGRIMPAVGMLRVDVMALLAQANAGTDPVALVDQLEASLNTFVEKIG